MAQEITGKVNARLTEEQLKAGIIRPYDSVVIQWKKSDFHKLDQEETVHPALAEKLVAAGKAIIIDASGDTTGRSVVTKLTKDEKSK